MAALLFGLPGCMAVETGPDRVVIEPNPTATPRPLTSPALTRAPFAPTQGEASLEPTAAGSQTDGGADTPAPGVTQPPLLTQAMNREGKSFTELTSKQLVLVYAEGTNAEIYCYRRKDEAWTLERELSYIRAYIGRNGMTRHKSEGDGCTPAGLYPLVFAFGHSKEPDTKLEYRQITRNTYWVDDPASTLYNRWTQQANQGLWTRAEDLYAAGPKYNYAVVIGYNYGTDTVAGAGSGIFLQCGSSPTAGGVCLLEESLLPILTWLDASQDPIILLSGE